MTDAQVLQDTQAWVEKAVIGLNLCPFAKAVQVQGKVRYVVSAATAVEDLLYELAAELNHLHDTPPEQTDTTLLIHPRVLTDFLDYNDFLEAADALVADIGLEGELQVASFHPQYQFEGTEPDDITNFTNRSPYPTLHLLREDSIDRAVAAFPNPESIFDTNMETLEKLGIEGWRKLGLKG
ncbi:MAG: DUF1415 domain-containing protein [Inhella sp.]|jgi:hypothetical protein|uniref:DUF1415 domain-containing protein n=1 Tax=Inhella sp. TaxID=1921806 RepID=UPI0022CB40FF|nr:DUF1415 domain-containing protein [Inhella sp.]MCZ8234031.1 DUF1415 domain-containing protein [Inhella sp.]